MDFYAFLDEEEEKDEKNNVSSKKEKRKCQILQKLFNNGNTTVEK
jgi:hypothetical protein